MGNTNTTRLILGSLRYKSAPDTDFVVATPLYQSTKLNIEYDRSIDLSLEQLFDDERQNSTIFRPTCKFQLLFENVLYGSTLYGPYKNSLYYINEQISVAANCPENPNIPWTGYPTYNEFDFIRTDYGVRGYTQPPNEHILFQPQSASSYNWNFYVSYAYENDYNQQMMIDDPSIINPITWTVSQGIPFIITATTYNGNGLISFQCPVKHGIQQGEFVKLSISYNNIDLFQVYSFGNGIFGSDEYVFNLYNVGFTGTTFQNGTSGTFRRVVDDSNIVDTISTYYVRKHKLLTNSTDAVMTKAGFEQNIFGQKRKFENSGYTPNHVARVSVKEGSQSYLLSFSKDININSLVDNQKRPLSELFFTVIYNGYFGWMFSGNNPVLRQGWEFNLPVKFNKVPSSWWTNPNSITNIPLSSYIKNGYKFNYVNALNVGDIIDGDFCEWNNYQQIERVVSKNYHKLTFNSLNFTVPKPPSLLNNNNPYGYYYSPLWGVKLRDFSSYIEFGDAQTIAGQPDWSYYSTTNDLFIWRDLLPYGYINSDGLGTNFPFLNMTHYPYENIVFRIIPEITNTQNQIVIGKTKIIAEPLVDNCE